MAGVAQATPNIQTCSNSGPNDAELCANREDGQTGDNTPVIGWTPGDNNNDFQFETIGQMCNGGHVTTTCPFTVGSGLNNAYNGDLIIQVYSPTSNSCVGGSSSTVFLAQLTPCQNQQGTGGGWSTIDVEKYAVTANGHDYYEIVNVHQSDQLYIAFGSRGCGGNSYGCTKVVGQEGHGYQLFLSVGDACSQAGNMSCVVPSDEWAQIT